MGLAVLPSRLKSEMEQLSAAILEGKNLREDEALAKHADWAEKFISENEITADNVNQIIQDEIGKVFSKVLEHAGVYKRTAEGFSAFEKFVEYVNGLN
jgi:UDPglucose--hexose-1-phosphate uridylyltransferase